MRGTGKILVAMVLVISIAEGSLAGPAEEADRKKGRAEEIARELVSLRRGLARTFIGAQTELMEQTFQQV